MELKKNDVITLEITGITSEGSAVGRYNGIAVFMAAGAIGDTVSAVVIKTKKNYVIAKIMEIIKPSADRINSDCSAFPMCGGCVYRHISYKSELEIKKQRVEDCIKKIGGFEDAVINDVSSLDKINAYRNKAQFPVGTDKDGRIITGFYSYHSHRIINCDNCLLQNDVFSKINRIFTNWANSYKLTVFNQETGKGLLRHLYIRCGELSGEIMVCIVSTSAAIPHLQELCDELLSFCKQIVSIVININTKKTNVILGDKCITVYGREYIYDTLCDLKFKLSPLSFYQVNRSQAEVLYGLVKKYAALTGKETVLDMYCGTGTIGLSCADSAKRIIGVEIVPQAVNDAKENAKLNNITNAEFILGDAEKAAISLKNRGISPDVIILDPPRKGCSQKLINTCCNMKPEKIIYVSCNPATQARDLKIMEELGYKLVEITPVNMFPRTAHIETCALLCREQEGTIYGKGKE